MKLTPAETYAAWWKQCGERQTREVDTTQCPSNQTHRCRVIEQDEFIKTIKRIIREAQCETL